MIYSFIYFYNNIFYALQIVIIYILLISILIRCIYLYKRNGKTHMVQYDTIVRVIDYMLTYQSK
jgi:hypothetical protein